MIENDYVLNFNKINLKDLLKVGGKNASLGEMISSLNEKGINVPKGFATTSHAFWEFIKHNDIGVKISQNISRFHGSAQTLQETGKNIRKLIYESEFPKELKNSILESYRSLSEQRAHEDIAVAVRSSATAEDLPNASFAGQLETFLNISGEKSLLEACKKCFASLYTDRAISYREAQGFVHEKVALSVGIQEMVRSDLAGSGVMFSIDTETGFKNAVVINASWGLGENIVKGVVNPDEYTVFKPSLANKKLNPILSKKLGSKECKMVYADGTSQSTLDIPTTKNEQNCFVLDEGEIIQLAQWAKDIEEHYGKAMDIEWAKDGKDDKLYIVQARPETVESQKDHNTFYQYRLLENKSPILTGMAIGKDIVTGKVQIIKNCSQITEFIDGSILVTEQTDPDWVPIMKKASGIITNSGGRTSHAAIVSRELGLAVIVGAKEATNILKDDDEITLSCAGGEQGEVYKGYLKFQKQEFNLEKIPPIKTELMLNLADPDSCFNWWQLPCNGIGLARMEFIISNIIKIHPMALVDFQKVTSSSVRKTIMELTKNHKDMEDYFVTELARGIAKLAASQYPKPCIVRMSDFKSNEYAGLIGGQYFEKAESNPMLGFRGAARYYSEEYRKAFDLECKAIKKARKEIGLDNIIVMIPFCRTLKEADKVLEIMAENKLERQKDGLEIYVMAEIPSNIILAEEFAKRFDGFSIGSNDLTQLTLGISRDSDQLSEIFDENDESVKYLIKDLIQKAHKSKTKVGFCGQAPSDRDNYAQFLVKNGIDSISLNPDSIIRNIEKIAEIENSIPSENDKKLQKLVDKIPALK